MPIVNLNKLQEMNNNFRIFRSPYATLSSNINKKHSNINTCTKRVHSKYKNVSDE